MFIQEHIFVFALMKCKHFLLYFECTSRINAGPSSKVQPQNAAHTLATLALFVEKYGFALSSAIHHLILKRA